MTSACTVSGMVPEFWPRVVKIESRYDPNAIHDDTANISHYPDSAPEAEALVRRLLAEGHSVGVGLSQLTANSEAGFVHKFGLSIHDALQPCLNMRAGASFYVTSALSIYNSGSPTRGMDYAMKVQGVTVATGDAAPTLISCAEPSWDVWAYQVCVDAAASIPDNEGE